MPSAPTSSSHTAVRHPRIEDGAHLWRMARDSQVLDVNASYAYLLWCRDFAGTSVVATVGGNPVGFVTGYRRPAAPATLMVWQVAVDRQHRGRGLARRMLHELLDAQPAAVSHLETTITAANEASVALFRAFAADRGAEVTHEPLFDAAVFPDGHDTELLFRIGPFG